VVYSRVRSNFLSFAFARCASFSRSTPPAVGQIATDLSISEHTVVTYIAKIMKKLGLHSRAQISAWVTEQRIPLVNPD
jgi:hypothetical protein